MTMKAYRIADLRLMAKRRLPRAVFDFINGGTEDERTLRDNCEAFGRVRFAPKQMVDVSAVDTSTAILGGPSKLSLEIAREAPGRLWFRACFPRPRESISNLSD